MPEEINRISMNRSCEVLMYERVSSMIKAIWIIPGWEREKWNPSINDALGALRLIQPNPRRKVQFTKEIENDLPPVLGTGFRWKRFYELCKEFFACYQT